jgi:hypothetical protein
MPKQTKIDTIIQQLTDQYSDELSTAFLQSIASITDTTVLANIVDAIKREDFSRAVELLSIESLAFRSMENKITEAFEVAGTRVAASVPHIVPDLFGVQAPLRFDVRSTSAETWLREASSQLVTRITDDTRAAVQTSLQASMIAGTNPRTAALDIVGRINPATGRRVGGVIGLNGPQEEYLRSARLELSSTDPELLNNYLDRSLRDKRLDTYVLKALRTGEAIPVDVQIKMAARYSDTMLKYRGDMIARTEMIETLNRAQYEAYGQGVASGKIQKSAVLKEWDSAGDNRVRESHRELDGVQVGLDEPFISPFTGASMMFPGDTSLGASGGDTIMCRCRVRYVVDFFAGVT